MTSQQGGERDDSACRFCGVELAGDDELRKRTCRDCDLELGDYES